MASESRKKVFGIGLHRTGTTSLRAAMIMLGYSTVPPWRWAGRYAQTLERENILNDAFNLAAKNDACVYMPFSPFYKELYDKYPDAKFVLTERDEDRWLQSMHDYFGNMNWPEVRFVFGVNADPEYADTLRQKYREHNAEVKEFFADKPDSLLVMNISNGDGWQELCDFIGEDIPFAQESFPRVNERGSIYASIVKNAVPAIANARKMVIGY